MSLKTFIEKIGHAFKVLFANISKEYKKLQPEVQVALKDGAGIIAFINDNIGLIPTLLKQGILKAFPHLTSAELDKALLVAAKDINLLIDIAAPTGEQALEAIQKHLKEATGVNWAKASDTLAKAIAIFRAPAGTKASVIFSFLVFVYQTFFKKP